MPEIYLIAEIGINHNGDMDIAKKLIKAASDAGFNAVKFQKRTVELVYSMEYLDSPRESPWGATQRDQKNGLEFSKSDYEEINRYCLSLGIDWSASAWDIDAQEFISGFNLKFNKVASAMLGNIPLLEKIAKEGRYTYISTGMATIPEIERVVSIFRDNNCKFELMHCNSSYPMLEEDANLLCIPMLRERFQCSVGYSGHESSLIKVCVVAATLGATSIERHITLDRTMYGSDQAASIEIDALPSFVKAIRKVPEILGTGEKSLTEKEIQVRSKLRISIGEEN